MVRKVRVLGVLAVLALVTAATGCGGKPSGGQGAPAQSGQSGSQQAAAQPSGGQAAAPAAAGATIKLGGIFDLTGGTGDVGTPYSEGVRDYVEFVNSKGGVNGRKIDLIWQDYAYKVPQAVDLYKKLVTQDKVVAIYGWGTGDTEAMKELIAKDKIPYVSGSLSENLRDPSKTPYNFLVAATYSDQARMALKWIAQQKPGAKVGFVYNDTPFGKSPLGDAKEFAQKLGLNWVGEVVVALNATEAATQMLELQKKGAEYALIQETTNATVVTLKEAKKLGLKTQFIGLNWAADEGVVKNAGDAAEGYIGVIPFAFPYESGRPGMKEIQEYLSAKGKKLEEKTQKYVQGWVSAKVIVDAIAQVKGEVTGESIKAALESFRNHDLGGLAAPVTFTDKDHAGAKTTRLYQVKNGRFEPLAEMSLD